MASYPKTYRAYRRTETPYPLHIHLTTETLPSTLPPTSLLLRIHAVALNYRDVAMLHEGRYPADIEASGVPCNDCAAEIVAIGDKVTKFVVGDHVAPTLNLAFLEGDERDAEAIALGGNGPGVLREYAIFEEGECVKLPGHLGWEEACIIPCAGITAWVALDSLKAVYHDTTVLLPGTGGVSMFALKICLAAGLRLIITSSSNAKLDKVKKISPTILGINYKETPNIADEVLRLTEGKGVDYVVNTTGLASVPSEIRMLRKMSGTISLVGFLEGFEANWKPEALFGLLTKAAKLQGILGGSRTDFESLNKFAGELVCASAESIHWPLWHCATITSTFLDIQYLGSMRDGRLLECRLEWSQVRHDKGRHTTGDAWLLKRASAACVPSVIELFRGEDDLLGIGLHSGLIAARTCCDGLAGKAFQDLR